MGQRRPSGPAEACVSKHAFATKQMAADVARRMRRRKDRAARCTPYQCPHCGMFHLGQSVGPMSFDRAKTRKRHA